MPKKKMKKKLKRKEGKMKVSRTALEEMRESGEVACCWNGEGSEPRGERAPPPQKREWREEDVVLRRR